MVDKTTLKFAQNREFPGFTKEEEGEWNGPFCFIQAADTQFGMIEGYIKKSENPGWDEEIELTKKAIAAANLMNPKPRFFIVCGDLIHAMPGTMFRKEQEEDFQKVFSDLHPDIPLVCVCGNHDVGNTPTADSIRNYHDRFGDDYFTFYCGGCMFIVINSQYFEDSSQVPEFAKDHDDWLDEQLEVAKSENLKHIVVFQHIPLFLFEPDEPKQYFNILLDKRKQLLEKFIDANIHAVFCGHYHRNAGGFYKDLEVIVTSAIGGQLGTDKSGFRVVKVLNDSISHQYYALEDAPKTIMLDS